MDSKNYDNKRIEVIFDDSTEAWPRESVRVIFGPHHFVEITKKDGKINFVLGVTHHGVKMDATVIDSELEKFIWESRERYPDTAID